MAEENELTLEETRAYVEDHALRRTKGVPPAVMAAHVLRITEGADFPVRRAAFEAITRRWDKVNEEQLVVLHAPSSRAPGHYVIGAKSSVKGGRKKIFPRPYDTLVEDVAELKGQCSCPDYLKGSLALCKHLVVAFVHAHAKQTKKGARVSKRTNAAPSPIVLRWNPVMPLVGPGDRLLGLLVEAADGVELPPGFRKDGEMDRRVLTSAASRFEITRELLDRARAGKSDPSYLDAGPGVIALLESERALYRRRPPSLRPIRIPGQSTRRMPRGWHP